MTKSRLCLLFAAVLLASAGARAQKNDLQRARPKTATLVSQYSDRDSRKSVFNFQHGIRGDKTFPGQPNVVSLKNLPDNRGLQTHHVGGSDSPQQANDLFRTADNAAPLGRQDSQREPSPGRVRYDIRYGRTVVNGDPNYLEIADSRGTQSVLKDLGAMTWDEVTRVPPLPASPTPHTGAVVYTRRGVGPGNLIVKAVAGHMYLLHVKDHKTEYYVMFRVESLGPNGECKLTWKRVPPPEG